MSCQPLHRSRIRGITPVMLRLIGLMGALWLSDAFPSTASAVTIIGNRDTWIQSNSPGTNYQTSVNPSSQLRNANSVTRASLYSFTLPALGAGNQISSVGFDVNVFGSGVLTWTADFALLASNPDLTTITWNSALAGSFITGTNGNNNPILGVNATAAGESWVVNQNFADGDEVLFTSAGGLTSLLNGVASQGSPVDVTLLVYTQGNGEADIGLFYGMENGESSEFQPRPRLHLELEPVPEPAGIALFLIGALGMCLRRRG